MKNILEKKWGDLVAILVLVILITVFFGKTLTGEEVFVTPDVGLSDILSFDYPPKLFLSEQLKQFKLPLWNSEISGGFPEGGTQTGNFNPINLILFYFFKMPAAFNLGFWATFLTTGVFSYLYCRSLKLSKLAAFFGGVIFTFSGIFISGIAHFMAIQTLSFFPVEIFLIEMLIQKKRIFWAILLSGAIGFQILAGYFQIALYSLITLTVYFLIRIFKIEKDYKFKERISALFLVAILSGFLISSVQLLPSIEFTLISTRQGGAGIEEIKKFPYPIEHLITFIWPYLLGDPRDGSYPIFSKNWGIFWENTGYLGILPLIFAGIAIYKGRKKYPLVNVFIVLLMMSFYLMLGKSSPAFFLYLLPPLSFFRVPARWIMFFSFSLMILAAFGWEIFFKSFPKKIDKVKVKIAILALILAVGNLWVFGAGYNLKGDSSKWLSPTQTADFLKKDASRFRIFSFGNTYLWNSQLFSKGWRGYEDKFLTFNEALEPNFNMVSNIDSIGSYPIIFTNRGEKVLGAINEGFIQSEDSFRINNISRNLLDMTNVKYLVSPVNLKARDLELVFKTKTDPVYYIWKNNTASERLFSVSNYQVKQKLADQLALISDEKFNPKESVILEKEIPNFDLKTASQTEVKIKKYSNDEIDIEAKTNNKTILVLADAYYPGWKGYVDGKEVEILAANINQRAIVLDKGEHLVKFVYQPMSFRVGALISLGTLILLSSLLVLSIKTRT